MPPELKSFLPLLHALGLAVAIGAALTLTAALVTIRGLKRQGVGEEGG